MQDNNTTTYVPYQEVADVVTTPLCGYCRIRPAEHFGVGGPKCTECEDMLME